MSLSGNEVAFPFFSPFSIHSILLMISNCNYSKRISNNNINNIKSIKTGKKRVVITIEWHPLGIRFSRPELNWCRQTWRQINKLISESANHLGVMCSCLSLKQGYLSLTLFKVFLGEVLRKWKQQSTKMCLPLTGTLFVLQMIDHE